MKTRRRKHKAGTENPKPGTLQLLPALESQERVATLDEIDVCISRSPNPKFIALAVAFHDAFRSGDTVIEFCSDRASWRAGMGLAGFLIRRNGTDIARLICKMN